MVLAEFPNAVRRITAQSAVARHPQSLPSCVVSPYDRFTILPYRQIAGEQLTGKLSFHLIENINHPGAVAEFFECVDDVYAKNLLSGFWQS